MARKLKKLWGELYYTTARSQIIWFNEEEQIIRIVGRDGTSEFRYDEYKEIQIMYRNEKKRGVLNTLLLITDGLSSEGSLAESLIADSMLYKKRVIVFYDIIFERDGREIHKQLDVIALKWDSVPKLVEKALNDATIIEEKLSEISLANRPTRELKKTPKNERERVSLLREYKKLLDEGIITNEQFTRKRDELMGDN